MSMLYTGAGSTTAAALRQGCNFLDPDAHGRAFNRVLHDLEPSKTLASRKPPATVRAACCVWTAPAVPLLPRYIEAVQQTYKSSVGVTDFSKPDAAAAQINRWCADNTGGHIQNLVSANDLQGVANGGCELALTSAVHFKGEWENRFFKESEQRTWSHEGGRTSAAYLMGLTSHYAFLQTDAFTTLKLTMDNHPKTGECAP
jgi:serine protease inhibitor